MQSDVFWVNKQQLQFNSSMWTRQQPFDSGTLPYFFAYKGDFSFQNNPKNLDPSTVDRGV